MKAYLHSISDVVTNSSTEIFTILKKDAISIAKAQLQQILDATQCNKCVDELFEVKARVRLLGESDAETVICTTDQDLNKALSQHPTTPPEECSLTVTVKGTGKTLDIMQGDRISETREFYC